MFSPSLQASIFVALRSFAHDLRAHANKLVKLWSCLSFIAAFKWPSSGHHVVAKFRMIEDDHNMALQIFRFKFYFSFIRKDLFLNLSMIAK